LDYQNQSLAIKWQIKDRFGEAASLNNLAAALLNSGNPKAAEENLRHSIAVKEAIRKDLGDNDALKISIFETQAHTYRLLQQVLIAQNRTKDALEIAEQGRARASPSVIVSLWRVGDNSAAVLMPEFYRQLQKSPNKAQALRRAMLNTMKNYPNPSDWAAFLLVGEAE